MHEKMIMKEYDETEKVEPLPPQDKKGRCTGHCCKAFQIGGLSIEELRLEYDYWLRGQTEGPPLEMSGNLERDNFRRQARERVRADIHVVYPMLVPLGKVKKNPLALVDDPVRIPEDFEGVHMFTCKHYQGGNCTIYDVRPLMCKSYGLREKSCEYLDCTWDGHRAEKRPDRSIRKYRQMDEPIGSPELEEELVEKADLGPLKASLQKVVSGRSTNHKGLAQSDFSGDLDLTKLTKG